MSYIVGATRNKRLYFARGGYSKTRVQAKERAFITKPVKLAAMLETKGWNNVQVIRCEGWGRPAKKTRHARR